MPQDLPPGYAGLPSDGAESRRSNVPVVPPEPAPGDYGPPERTRRRAFLALAVAVVGLGAFVAGVRQAVRRIPPDAEARAAVRADSARRARDADMARRRAEYGRPGPGGGPSRPSGADVPRLQ